MPHIQITLLKGRTIEQKRRAVKRITEVMQEELDVKQLQLFKVGEHCRLPSWKWLVKTTPAMER